MATRADWLALTTEPTLEPDLPICDPHYHLWDRGPEDRYLLTDLLKEVSGGHNVVATVFVEFRSQYRQDGAPELKPVGETEFVERIAAESASGRHGRTRVAAAIMGFADLTLGAGVAKVLEAHLAASPTRFRGVRHSGSWVENGAAIGMQFRSPKGVLMDAKYREGLACLKKYNLVYDAWQLYPQLPEFIDLARAFPDQPMVLNHIGGMLGVGPYAGRRDEIYAQWQRDIDKVAELPNVFVKLGGLCTPRCGFGWSEQPRPPSSEELAKAFAPYYLHCIEKFGPSRCMFESNFPVDRASSSYNVLWNSFKRLTQKFSPAERAALFHDTAARAYRLDGS